MHIRIDDGTTEVVETQSSAVEASRLSWRRTEPTIETFQPHRAVRQITFFPTHRQVEHRLVMYCVAMRPTSITRKTQPQCSLQGMYV
jgi:hypothetical protein